MLKSDAGLASPEDLRPGLINRDPRPEQLELNDYVDRSRRMHRNDLENIPAFLACGLLFVAAGPSYLLANILMYGFVGARATHSLAYATKQSHEVRATFLHDRLRRGDRHGGLCSGGCHRVTAAPGAGFVLFCKTPLVL